jgi:hypothetical protein
MKYQPIVEEKPINYKTTNKPSLHPLRLITPTQNQNKVGTNLLSKNIEKESKQILLKAQYNTTIRTVTTKRKNPEK